MNSNAENLLLALDDEIENKCIELKQKKLNRKLQLIFIWACVAFVIMPCLLIFVGINLFTLCFPVIILFAVALVLFTPILSADSGGFAK